MKSIINGKLFVNQQFHEDLCVVFDNKIQYIINDLEKVQEDIDEVIDAKGMYVVPGFIDVHVHGYHGYDVMDCTEECLNLISMGLLENGVTAFLPTTMSAPEHDVINVLKNVKKVMGTTLGAEILGVHLEGPFISKVKKGAHNEKYISDNDLTLIHNFKDVIKIITLAPENKGALEFIKKIDDENKIKISIGHSNVSYEETKEFLNLGAEGITHLFNAMSSLEHRKPGVALAGLIERCYCEVIADNIHIHPEMYKLISTMKKSEEIVLITDCMSGGGMKDGKYYLGGQTVHINDGHCTIEDGTLAGSVLKLNRGMKNFATGAELNMAEVIPLSTINPARYLGINSYKGSIEVGKDSDIVLLDDNYEVKMTIKGGKIVYAV